MSVLRRNNVTVTAGVRSPLVFVHGYGCDQHIWRLITSAFAGDHTIILYDLTGAGQSDLAAYDREKYRTLDGHATDLLEICEALDLADVTVVGHSVGAMIAMLAFNREPTRFTSLVMIGPSPCYINDGDYVGGFSRAEIQGLVEFLDLNFVAWSTQMAPAIMGVPHQPELAAELAASFCRTDVEIARHFGKLTFLSDHRGDVVLLAHRTLVLQCNADIVAPLAVGSWLHEHIPHSQLIVMEATGHCPHLSAPNETIDVIKHFLN
jgi:sigma-B regulation protein RsbQ